MSFFHSCIYLHCVVLVQRHPTARDTLRKIAVRVVTRVVTVRRDTTSCYTRSLIGDNYTRIVFESYSDRIFLRATRPRNRTLLIPECDRVVVLWSKVRFESQFTTIKIMRYLGTVP